MQNKKEEKKKIAVLRNSTKSLQALSRRKGPPPIPQSIMRFDHRLSANDFLHAEIYVSR